MSAFDPKQTLKPTPAAMHTLNEEAELAIAPEAMAEYVGLAAGLR